MELIKCRSCDKLLAKTSGYLRLEIKCPRCKSLNLLSVKNAPADCPEQRMGSNHGATQ